MENAILNHADIIIQIATPTNKGIGFYLKPCDIIVTTANIVNNLNEVSISGKLFTKAISEVFFIDNVHNIAFLKKPSNVNFPDIKTGNYRDIEVGHKIIAFGFTSENNLTASKGIISKAEYKSNALNYVHAELPSKFILNGSPIVNENYEIIGINSFSEDKRTTSGLAIEYVLSSFEEFEKLNCEKAVRCTGCNHIIPSSEFEKKYCKNCGESFKKISFFSKENITNITHIKIEDVIESLGFDVRLTRLSINFWELENKELKINISLNPKTKFIEAYCEIGKLPPKDLAEIYEYLLKENHELKRVWLSLNKNKIVLEIPKIYETDIEFNSFKESITRLMIKSEQNRKILIEKYLLQTP